jgi:hypothetical protein
LSPGRRPPFIVCPLSSARRARCKPFPSQRRLGGHQVVGGPLPIATAPWVNQAVPAAASGNRPMPRATNGLPASTAGPVGAAQAPDASDNALARAGHRTSHGHRRRAADWDRDREPLFPIPIRMMEMPFARSGWVRAPRGRAHHRHRSRRGGRARSRGAARRRHRAPRALRWSASLGLTLAPLATMPALRALRPSAGYLPPVVKPPRARISVAGQVLYLIERGTPFRKAVDDGDPKEVWRYLRKGH